MTKKPTVTTLQSGFNSTQTLNANFEALRDSFDNTLSLDGSTPNAMEADLDLNGNDIINASVIGTSSLVVNGKLISVSNDPVFDGTVSVFGANLIADADAAAVKTTLGLSTVASTGSYTDLSNQPSLNFASPAQGALADSALQVGDSLDAGNLVNALPAIDGSALTGIVSSHVSTKVTAPAQNATVSATHGLGVIPDQVSFRITCTVANAGFSVGDIMYYGGSFIELQAGFGFNVTATTTTTSVRRSNYAWRCALNNSYTTITNTSWDIEIISEAF
jgi:hypothetical protein